MMTKSCSTSKFILYGCFTSLFYKAISQCGQLMWSKALTLQYHSEPFESTPVAFLRIKTGESIR